MGGGNSKNTNCFSWIKIGIGKGVKLMDFYRENTI
ncbi:Putative protein [Zobellia galactanivorans]|uniref:Uncharacterized protein n=1 Tax=Zobellia galactanivorans (strain DSM 12802 / CCUG 47099 / CIP 106680 / NCIMB 13871 / Dsij) TaxID=63186 RepID=G0KZK0_ZOBGA|nr:Putative protein [Zobellia galactanivorans]